MKGEEIRELRKKLGLTQEEFARLLGVGYTTINRWENGKSEPRGQASEILEKLKTIIEEAEKGRDITLEELKEILKDLGNGRLVSNLSGIVPGSILGLVAAGGLIGFLTGLSTAYLVKKLMERKENEKSS